jgi:hypothetical protein
MDRSSSTAFFCHEFVALRLLAAIRMGLGGAHADGSADHIDRLDGRRRCCPGEEAVMKLLHSLTIGILLGLVLVIGSSQIASAQGTGSIEIHKRVCPSGEIVNLFDDCHGNPPTQPVSFSLDGGPAQLVDADGNLTFTGLAAGTYQISEVEGIPLDFATLKVWCSVQGDNPVPFEVTTDGPNFSVDVGDGEQIVCDVYNIPENLSGLTPTPVATATPSIQLPNTGSGVGTGSDLLTTLAYGALLAALALTTIGLARRMIDSPSDTKHTRR